MSRFELIRLQPRDNTCYVSQNRTALATNRDGIISGAPDEGLFVHETRMLSRYLFLLNGKPPLPVAVSNVKEYSWLGYFIAPPPEKSASVETAGQGAPDAAQHSIELRVSRFVGDGFHEDLDLTNFTGEDVAFEFSVQLDADFADIDELGGPRKQNGSIKRDWTENQLILEYSSRHEYDQQGNTGTATIDRTLAIKIENATTAPAYKDGHISFAVQLPPHAKWHACLNFIPTIEGKLYPPIYGCNSFTPKPNEWDQRRSLFLSESASFNTPESHTLTNTVVITLEQARKDLAALRLYDLDHNPDSWTVVAGLPVYMALFGRDTLTAAWQAGLISAQLMTGTLTELSKWQGKEINDWRDEEPGRMIHEAHTGPLKILNFDPRARSYCSVTTSGFFPVVVAELWHWTGNKELVGPFLEPALKALRWADRYSDIDHDGFYEYQTKSKQGVENQAWKDSGDAIVYEDGSQVKPPIATCEEQGFLYLAKFVLSEVLWWFDRKEESSQMYREATELKSRFNEAFWMEDEGFFAMGLDSQKRKIRSISSNPGHCIASGIVDERLVEAAIGRFIAADLFTGWGIRTLSSKHPSYNPYSYHRGSVWPVEQGTFAIGFMRYGLPKHVQLLAKAQFEAAGLFKYCRLPELFSGHQRDEEHPFPALYPKANWPQAWSASAVFSLLQALLGLYPYAPLHLLLVDPHLPDWLPEITVENLHVGESIASIRFFRRANGSTDYSVEKLRGSLHVVRQPSPWSLTATLPERAGDLLMSLVPGK